MAINPSSRYPGKIRSADSAYPYGSARNVTVPGDGTGTPWDENLINDMWGMFQKLLQTAGIAPSGNPDTVQASQYFDALRGVAGSSRRIVTANTTLTAYDAGYVMLVGQASSAPTVTLPPAASAASGRFVFVATNQTGETPQIVTTGGERIIGRNAFAQPGGDTNIYLDPGTSRTLISNGTAWYEVSGARATDREYGPVRFASVSETASGGGDAAVSPFGLMQQFVGAGKQRLTASGYQRLPGGLILQWEKQRIAPGPAGADQVQVGTVAYPIAFPNSVLALVIVSHGAEFENVQPSLGATISNSQYTMVANGHARSYGMIALGY